MISIMSTPSNNYSSTIITSSTITNNNINDDDVLDNNNNDDDLIEFIDDVTATTAAVGNNNNADTTTNTTTSGRPIEAVWVIFTNDLEPQKQFSSKCKWCSADVKHCKKSLSVKTHLSKKCLAYKQHTAKLQNKSLPAFMQIAIPNNQIQTKVTSIMLPGLTYQEQRSFASMLSMHYYMTGTSFSRIDCPFLVKALKILRPDIKVPNRKRIGGQLLKQEVKRYRTKVNAQTASSENKHCITMDGWSNVNGDSILTYNDFTNGKSFYIESNATEDQSHTAEYFKQDLIRVMQNIDPSPLM